MSDLIGPLNQIIFYDTAIYLYIKKYFYCYYHRSFYDRIEVSKTLHGNIEN